MARLRARRSRYRLHHRLATSAPAVIVGALLIVMIGGTTLFAARVLNFLGAVTGGASISQIGQAVAPNAEPGTSSIAYKIKHRETINVLLLGYGGNENDAPYLTDSIMVARLDTATNRVALISIPRDLWVGIQYSNVNGTYNQKINAAFEVGMDESGWSGRLPRYTGRDGGGHLSEDTVGHLTGLTFDRYMGVDFKAFRDVVDALGGITVHMDLPLDDCHYPDYKNGYVNHGVGPGYRCPPGAGIHYKAGDYAVTGEQALQIARSRDAEQPEQATDFGRARRQQMIIAEIKKQALGINAIVKAPQLMNALQKNVRTDLTIDDMAALYRWGGRIPDSSILHFALTNDNLLEAGNCGQDYGVYALCPTDGSNKMIQSYVANTLPPPAVTRAHAPLQFFWSGQLPDMVNGVADLMKPFGFEVADPQSPRVRVPPQKTVIYDFSGGAYPDAAEWLSQFFGADIVAPSQSQPPAFVKDNGGFAVYLGHDFGSRWYNNNR
ncbi:MAG: LytR family transcriptional regulator [Chloroflexi bacterium]|nr:MAG: LytR family transcriptional regulator [Chloroflexota bacterium]